jgi:acetyl esterase/lipase
MLFFARPEAELHTCTELILDFPGGGFIAMGPDCHEERLRRWAKRTGKPVLSVDYGKAPECEKKYRQWVGSWLI